MMEPIIKVLVTEMQTKMEEDCLKVVVSYGFEVDKERLEQALAHAHRFYYEGFEDGLKSVLRPAHWIPRTHDDGFGEYTMYHCSKCDTQEARQEKFCRECGAKMDQEAPDGKEQ